MLDEWHIAQNAGVLLLPFYSVYYGLFHTTEGILLAFRYIFCVLWSATAVYVYRCLRPYTRLALAAAVYLLLLAPLDQMTLSYTSLSLMGNLVTACLCMKMLRDQQRYTTLRYTAALGLAQVITVLACPAMALAYIGFSVAVLAVCIFDRLRSSSSSAKPYLCRVWAGMTIPIAVCMLLYGAFAFSRCSPADFLQGALRLLRDPNPEHASGILPLFSLWNIPYLLYSSARPFTIGLAALCAIALVCGSARRRIRLWLLLAGAALWCTAVFPLLRGYIFNYQMKDIALLGVLAFLLLEQKPWPLFLAFYGVSAIYTYADYLTTNTDLMAISMTLSVGGAAGIVCLVLLGRELYTQYRNRCSRAAAAWGIVALLLCGQLMMQGYLRLRYSYWDTAVWAMDAQITQGPARGIRTSQSEKDSYDTVYRELMALLADKPVAGKSFLCYSNIPWVYLAADMRYATFSAWTFGYGDTLPSTLRAWFASGHNPPDYIFFALPDENAPLPVPGYTMEQMGDACLLSRNSS